MSRHALVVLVLLCVQISWTHVIITSKDVEHVNVTSQIVTEIPEYVSETTNESNITGHSTANCSAVGSGELSNTESATNLSDDSSEFKNTGSTNETSLPWWRRRPYPLRQSASRPCQCEDYTCGCCAGIELQRLNFSRRGCLNFRYDPDDFALEMEVLMNDRTLIRRSVSGRSPPPLCIPLPSPVSFIPRVEFCARAFNIFTPGRNLHMCLDFTTKISQSPVIVIEFDCMRIGADGFALLKPEDGGGLVGVSGGAGGGGGGVGGGGDYGGVDIAAPEGGDEYDQLEPDVPEGNKRPTKKPIKQPTSGTGAKHNVNVTSSGIETTETESTVTEITNTETVVSNSYVPISSVTEVATSTATKSTNTVTEATNAVPETTKTVTESTKTSTETTTDATDETSAVIKMSD